MERWLEAEDKWRILDSRIQYQHAVTLRPCCSAANAADASLARPSLDPTKAVLAQDSFGSSVGGGEASKPAAEPTKRKAGRFTVTEEGGGAAAAAAAAAAVAAVDGAAKPKAAGPVALTGIYPRLQVRGGIC